MNNLTKEQLESMLQDVLKELNLSQNMIVKHKALGTTPAELVRLVLDGKDKEIKMLEQEGF